MLHYHPQHRPMMADIVGHPWLAGKTATQSEIAQEFSQRLEQVNKRVSEDQIAEKNEKRTRRAAVIKGKLYVYGGLTEEEKTSNTYEVVAPKINPYYPSQNKNTCFFSDINPEIICKTIADHFEEKAQDYEISEKKFRMFYKVEKVSNQKPLEPIEGLEELAEESKEFEPITEEAEI